jgi:Transposase DDE domain/Domain of unknown function (DUF4372)
MRHQNTVFHALLKQVPWRLFERLVDEYRADRRIRKLDTKTQLIALLYGQLSGSTSLREIEAGLASHRARLYHVGARAVARSTLADANTMRPVEVFAGLFKHVLGQVHRGLRRKTRDAVRLIDATGVRLSNLSAGWAMFSNGVCGAKLHVVLDPDADIPLYFAVTTAKVNDITAAKAMPIEPGATYVFDLGYYDFGWWAALDAQGCRLVTRLKSNTRVTVVHENAVQQGSNIISDRIGHLPDRMAASRTNPFQDPVREIKVAIEGGTVLRLVTNDLDAPAEEIAELYKRRWQVELFFRWVKQTLKIKHFLGTSENAVRIQIAVALIAFLLLRLAQAGQDSIQGALNFARVVRTNLMHRRPIDRLLTPALPPPRDDNQLSFSLPLA